VQQRIEADAILNDPLTRDRLIRISHLCAHCWGATRREIESFPCKGEMPLLARRVAIALSRELMFTTLERLAVHYGGNAGTIAAACNRIAEQLEWDGELRTTVGFLKHACAAVLDPATG
jgi:chromosomal replication initiation ATPase DnaA